MKAQWWLAGLAITVMGCMTLMGLDDVSYRAPALDAGTTPVTIDQRCPQDRGPTMLRVADVGGQAAFCIDTTEVTVAQYLEFAKSNAPLNADPRCGWNTDPNAPGTDEVGDLPVTQVDFCDALAYCKWANKTLCGEADGTPSPPDNDAGANAWVLACSAHGNKTFSYGNKFNDKACNIGSRVEKIKSRIGCQGGYSGMYDMGGNAAEWLDACRRTSDAGFACTTTYAVGVGQSGAPQEQRACSAAFLGEDPITIRRPTLGFRCCSRALD